MATATDTITLAATIRDGRGKGPARATRRAGEVPAIIYGLGGDNIAVSVPAHELDLILRSETGVNSIITLQVNGKDQLALCRQIHRHPVKGSLVHVDFVRVSADVAITADVSVSLVGDSPGVRAGGRLEQLLFSITITAKPGDIPTDIEHDITSLGLGDQVLVSTLALPSGVTAVNDADQLVAHVVIPRGSAAATGAEGEGGEAPSGAAEAPAEGGEAED